jgi:MFS family permease
MSVLERAAVETRAPGRMDGRHRLILFLLLGTQFMLSVDFSILNVALPAIGRGMHLELTTLQWVATAFALPAAGFTLLFGRVGDLFGRRRLFFAGLGLLAAASLMGGLSTGPVMLLTARVLQGLACALATPAALSLITTSFPEGPLRDRALGLNGALLSGGFTVGALVGGVLTDALSWRWAFLVNVPVALTILAVAPSLIRPSRAPDRARLDVPGAATVTLGLLALIYGITEAAATGWGSPVALGSLALAVVLLVAFWRVELRAEAPLAPLRILTRSSVKWGNFGGLVVFSMESAIVFLMTLYLQQVLRYSPLATGIAFGVPGVAAVAGGILAPRIIERTGPRVALVGGLVVQAAGNAVLLLCGTHRSGIAIMLGALLFGFFGHLVALVAYTVTATSGLPDSEQGLATGLSTLTQQVAITIGIPILSAVAAARTGALRGVLDPARATLGGIHLALVVDVAVTLVGAALIWVGLRRRAGR